MVINLPQVGGLRRFCVLDVETSGGNWSSFPLGFNLLLIGIREQDNYHVYTAEKTSLSDLRRFLLSFDGPIVTFNGFHFDMPIINHYFDKTLGETSVVLPNHYDILEEIHKKAGHRISLDNLAKYTIGQKKMPWDHRNNAHVWATEPHRLVEYNRVDLDLTHELFSRIIREEHMFLGTSTILLPQPPQGHT
jgi:hypothetical protein